MKVLRGLCVRLGNLLRKTHNDREFEAELEAHVDMHVADNVRAGLPPAEARRRALVALGGMEQAKERHRDRRGFRFVEELMQDLRFAARLLARDRGFAVTAVLVLGFGIGMSNTFFTIVNATCFHGLSLDQVDRVMDLSTLDKAGRERRMSHLDLEDLRASAGTFTGIASFAPRGGAPMSIGDDQRAPERFLGAYVSSNIFQLIGEVPLAGRDFRSDDDLVGAPAVVLLGRTVWEGRYGGDPSIVGRVIHVNGEPAMVIGVMPDRSKFPSNALVWQPMHLMPGLAVEKRDARILSALGRLSTRTNPAHAQAEVQAIGERLSREHPDTNAGIRMRAIPINAEYVANFDDPAWQAFVTVGALVLLIACANVANLLMMHSVGRAREMGIRSSLGATRGRVVRQLLAESGLLALAGGVLGFAFSVIGTRVLWASIPEGFMPYWMTFALDRRAVVALTGLCLASGVLFGLSPAIQISKTDIAGFLKDGGRTASKGIRVRRWTSAFLIAQFGLGTLFIAFIGLTLSNFRNGERTDAKIDMTNLVTASIVLPGQRYGTAEARRVFYERLDGRLREVGSIASATIASALPFGGAAARRLAIEARDSVDQKTAPTVWTVAIGERYLETLGLQTLRGRPLDARDARPGQDGVVVNQQFADMYFPNIDPIGRRIRLSAEGATASAQPWLTIVGVSPTIRQRDNPEPDAVAYLPYGAEAPALASLIVRGRSGPAGIASVLRKEAQALDPDLPLFRVMSLDQAIDETRWLGHISNVLASAISFVAIGLALVGLYALTAHSVAQRTQEMGVRLALGAQPWRLAWLTLRRASYQLGTGLMLGIACTLVWDKLFYTSGPHITDPSTLLSAAALLVVLAVVACLVPVLRAVRLDPVVVLRYE